MGLNKSLFYIVVSSHVVDEVLDVGVVSSGFAWVHG